MRYAYRKEYLWSRHLAYVAGLIASDGCLSNDGRHINITSAEWDLLEMVRALLSLECKIGQKRNGYGGMGYFLQFSDVSLYDFLLKSGITPAKSKIISKVKVPDNLYGDFLRGLFDGDGTIYGFWDKRWPSSLMYYVEFTSASTVFLDWIQSSNTRLIGSGGRVKRGVRASKLVYAKSDSRKIFDLMYSDDDLPALSRKRSKFIDFLISDPYADIELRASGGIR